MSGYTDEDAPASIRDRIERVSHEELRQLASELVDELEAQAGRLLPPDAETRCAKCGSPLASCDVCAAPAQCGELTCTDHTREAAIQHSEEKP